MVGEGAKASSGPPAVVEDLPVPAVRNKNRPNYTHQAMIDFMLSNPGVSQNAIAHHFGYTPAWISTMMASDAFQAMYAERREQMVDPAVQATIEANLKGAMHRSMDILNAKLNKPINEIPDNLVLRTLDVTSRALGYGAKETKVAVQVNLEQHLDTMSERLTTLLQRRKTLIATPSELDKALESF